MTKVTVFGQEEQGNVKKRPIEFVKYLNDFGVHETTTVPSYYDNVCLLGTPIYSSLHLILAWNDGAEKVQYLGHWNDGVV